MCSWILNTCILISDYFKNTYLSQMNWDTQYKISKTNLIWRNWWSGNCSASSREIYIYFKVFFCLKSFCHASPVTYILNPWQQYPLLYPLRHCVLCYFQVQQIDCTILRSFSSTFSPVIPLLLKIIYFSYRENGWGEIIISGFVNDLTNDINFNSLIVKSWGTTWVKKKSLVRTTYKSSSFPFFPFFGFPMNYAT